MSVPMRPIIAVTLAVVCAGCAGTQSELRILENQNALQVDPSPTADASFVVSIRNVIDFGYDPDIKATRDATALQALKTQCPEGVIVGETVIDTGTYLLGNSSRTYAIKVKC